MLVPGEINPSAFTYYVRLQKVKAYLDGHVSEPLTLDQAANIAGLERKYFSTFFRKRTGVCFRDWVAWVRVQQAAAMLKSKNYSITRLAFAVGFKDPRTFQRAFKKYAGVTPRSFKQMVRPDHVRDSDSSLAAPVAPPFDRTRTPPSP